MKCKAAVYLGDERKDLLRGHHEWWILYRPVLSPAEQADNKSRKNDSQNLVSPTIQVCRMNGFICVRSVGLSVAGWQRQSTQSARLGGSPPQNHAPQLKANLTVVDVHNNIENPDDTRSIRPTCLTTKYTMAHLARQLQNATGQFQDMQKGMILPALLVPACVN